MPIEVFPIKGITNGTIAGREYRGAHEVAEDIRQVYETVTERGGEIVGSHQVEAAGVKRSLTNFLYLVANIPEQTT